MSSSTSKAAATRSQFQPWSRRWRSPGAQPDAPRARSALSRSGSAGLWLKGSRRESPPQTNPVHHQRQGISRLLNESEYPMIFFASPAPSSSRSASARRPPRQLRIPPVDSFEHVRHLSCRNRNDALLRRRPDELSPVEPLGVERQPDATSLVFRSSPGAAVSPPPIRAAAPSLRSQREAKSSRLAWLPRCEPAFAM